MYPGSLPPGGGGWGLGRPSSDTMGKECRSIVRGESVYLTMLSGHSRHTHSVSVPNISVLLHTHVEAVLKFEVVSHFANF